MNESTIDKVALWMRFCQTSVLSNRSKTKGATSQKIHGYFWFFRVFSWYSEMLCQQQYFLKTTFFSASSGYIFVVLLCYFLFFSYPSLMKVAQVCNRLKQNNYLLIKKHAVVITVTNISKTLQNNQNSHVICTSRVLCLQPLCTMQRSWKQIYLPKWHYKWNQNKWVCNAL